VDGETYFDFLADDFIFEFPFARQHGARSRF
jgi:hypothetical protein